MVNKKGVNTFVLQLLYRLNLNKNKTMKITKVFLILLSFSAFFFTSCGDDEVVTPIEPTLQIPTTYNFENVSYPGQQSRLAQFLELKNYIGTSKSGEVLDAAKLAAMYANAEGAGFSQQYTKQLRSKTFESVVADFDALLEELAAASQSTTAGSEGVSGVIVSNNGEKKYLIGDDGLDHAQLFEKGLMGACLYYQMTTVYLGEAKMANADNTTVNEGEGTDMEHHWDESWGYFGAPIDFPTNVDGLSFWASYANKRNAVLGNSQAIMDAYLKGRAAISAKDYAKRDEAITEVRKQLELVSVASALHYLNSTIEKFDDKAIALHGLSEVIGFIYALKFNEDKKIPNAKIDQYLTNIAGSANFASMNVYTNATVEKLTTVRNDLAADYGIESQKEEF